MALRGGRELRRRLKAIRTVFKPLARSWGEKTVQLASSRVRVRTGKTKRSIRIKNASQRRAAVEAKGGARFLEAGTDPHELEARRFEAMRFSVGGHPQFARRVKHPGQRKRPFLRNSGKDALKRTPMLDELVKLWNNAA